MMVQLGDLSRTDIKRIAGVLARAFAEDRLFKDYYFVDAGPRYDAFLMCLMLYGVRHGLLYGEVCATSHRYEGIAIWYPPSFTGPSMWKDLRAGGISLLLRAGRSAIARLNEHVAYSTRLFSDHVARSALPHTDQWLLWALCVDPKHQKQGYASQLMRPMLRRLDREGTPCHLDTQNPDNLPLYAHYGFEVVAEGCIPGTDIPHWLLERQPSR